MSHRSLSILYWGSTVLLAVMMAGLAFAYFTQPFFVAAFEHLGYPQYFRVMLALAKAVGAILLVATVPERLKTFAYDGFAIMFACGAFAHAAAGDPPARLSAALIAMTLLIVSYVTREKLRTLAREEVPSITEHASRELATR